MNNNIIKVFLPVFDQMTSSQSVKYENCGVKPRG